MSPSRRNLFIGLGAVLLVAALGWGLFKMLSGKPDAPRKAPKISLIPSTPPPPPPPPKEEKKPEPPKEQKEVKVDQPVAPKDAPPAPPSQDLKMDGPAGDGPSAFGAGKITNDDLSNIGKGGGGGTTPGVNPFTVYAGVLKAELQRHLSRQKDLRLAAYKVDLQLWVGRDGAITRHELTGSTGDKDIDELLRQALAAMPNVTQLPPERMPQPIRLRLITGGR